MQHATQGRSACDCTVAVVFWMEEEDAQTTQGAYFAYLLTPVLFGLPSPSRKQLSYFDLRTILFGNVRSDRSASHVTVTATPKYKSAKFTGARTCYWDTLSQQHYLTNCPFVHCLQGVSVVDMKQLQSCACMAVMH